MVQTTLLDAPFRERSIYDYVVDQVPLTTPIPAVFDGLEAWLTTATKPGAPASYQVGLPASDGTYSGRLTDQSTRYSYVGPGGSVRRFVEYATIAQGQQSIPALTSAAQGVGGIPALSVTRAGQGLFLPTERSQMQDPAAAVRPFLTEEYTLALIFAAPSDAIGGIMSVGATNAPYDNGDPNAGCAFRLGFLDNANQGKVLVQYGNQGAQRLTFDRTIGNWTRTIFLLRGFKSGSQHMGSLIVKSGGVMTQHSFGVGFAYGRLNMDMGQPAPHLGAQGPGDPTRPQYARKITHCLAFSRHFTDAQVAGFIRELERPLHGGAF